MVFEKLKRRLLESQLKKAKAVSNKEEALAQKRITILVKEEKTRQAILKEKLKVEKIQQDLKDQIKNAKKLNLTPTEKKVLERRMKIQQQRRDTLEKNARIIGAGLKKGAILTAQFLSKIAEQDTPRKTVKKRKSTKKKTTVKRRRR